MYSYLKHITYSGLSLALLTFLIACGQKKNIAKEGKLYIPTGANFQQILDSIKPFLKNPESFKDYASSKQMDKRFYPGRYSLKEKMTNEEIVNNIQTGKQDEIPVMIGNYSSIFELAGKMASVFESDSIEILTAIVNADFTKNIDSAQKLYAYLPNTYNFHWNTSGTAFVAKMQKEYEKFWTNDRLNKAKASNMTPLEITNLAAIVQLESKHPDEQPKVAGAYLNRLKIGMKLDADPTIVYIKKMQNGFSQKVYRVYYKDLAIESPYNTYLYKGLPPSPICMPNPSAIDAVLQAEKHDYIYFVADTAKAGYHIFAKNFEEHKKNTAAYTIWANKNNVK